MSEKSDNFSIVDAQKLIAANDIDGRFTPNQSNFKDAHWLWDSCFIACGLAYTDPVRAKQELLSVMESQHQDGMVPHVVFRRDVRSGRIANSMLWGKATNARGDILTSAISQPPVIATATRLVAENLDDKKERLEFLNLMFSGLVNYHSKWWLGVRDHNQDGLASIIHPWESGMDNSPSMLAGVHPNNRDRWIGNLLDRFRLDVSDGLDSKLRTSPEYGVALIGLVYRLKRKRFDSANILSNEPITYAMESVLLNSILLKGTKDLAWISEQLGEDLPVTLKDYLAKSRHTMNKFWHSQDKRFYDIDTVTGEHVTIPTIANLLPIINYEDLTKEQLASIIALLNNPDQFAAEFGAPTVAKNSEYFNHLAYWSGPMWPWMNRYLFHGAFQSGHRDIAVQLRDAVMRAVNKHGFYEHYSPLTSEPGGAKQFAPTAGTYLELASFKA